MNEEFDRDTGKYFLFTTPLLIFAIFLFSQFVTEGLKPAPNVAILALSGSAGLWFALSFLVRLPRLFDSGPGLILTPEGLFNRTRFADLPPVVWSQIESVGVWTAARSGSRIYLKLSDRFSYARQLGGLSTLRARWFLLLTGRVCILAFGLRGEAAEVGATIRRFQRNYAP